MSHPLVPTPGTNLAVLVGTLSRPAELRHLPSGDQVVALEVMIRAEGRPAESVPVAWTGAPAAAATWPEGAAVLVVGRVRRRFFQAAGRTQSRTEVVASIAVPTRRAVAAGRALQGAVAALTGRS
jgi:single-strand DNA-binding protein